MTMMRLVDPRLKKFVKYMRYKLELPRNQAKSDWRELAPATNLQAIGRELEELRAAFKTGNPELIILECADVANRAMMLADQTIDSHHREFIESQKGEL